MSGPYPRGDTVTMTSTPFTNLATGAPFDPSDVTLTIVDPNNLKTVVPMGSLTHVATGVFSYSTVVDTPGEWTYAFTGSGNCAVRGFDVVFTVLRTRLEAG